MLKLEKHRGCPPQFDALRNVCSGESAVDVADNSVLSNSQRAQNVQNISQDENKGLVCNI